MSYRCLNQVTFSLDDYTIVPIRHEDMLNIMQWRNDQIRYLRQNEPLTEKQQEHYYRNVLTPSFSEEHPSQVLVSLLYKGVCIGYGGIVHIDWLSSRGEVSFLVDTKRTLDPVVYRQDFVHFLKLIKQLAFKDLHFHRLHGETYDIRPLHIEILESQGFIREGCLREHIYIEGKYVDAILHGCLASEAEI
jgi:RimJ/RimL family protein N-acetyltransferase